jgi:peptidoglycan/LPS O-acetylase OafA/YrhL
MPKRGHSADSVYQYRYFGSFRLLLAMLVMEQHFVADLAPAPLAIALAPYAFGNVAVLVFFALSGFVITEAVDSIYRGRPGAFLTNRLLRIFCWPLRSRCWHTRSSVWTGVFAYGGPSHRFRPTLSHCTT